MEARLQQTWRRVPFELKLALLVLMLALPYAAVYSNMVYASVMEQHVMVGRLLPRYATPPHLHNAAEWVLLVTPAVVGWLATLTSAFFLARRLASALWKSASNQM